MFASRGYRKLLEFDPELQDLAAEDAVDSTLVAAAAVNWNAADHELLSYEGPFGVGYGVAILHEPPLDSIPTGAHDAGTRESEVTEIGKALAQIARRRSKPRSAATRKNRPSRRRATWASGTASLSPSAIRSKVARLCWHNNTVFCEHSAEETWHVARDAAFP